MKTRKLYFAVRDFLVARQIIEGPRFYMERHPAGMVRNRHHDSFRLRGRLRNQQYGLAELNRLLGK